MTKSLMLVARVSYAGASYSCRFLTDVQLVDVIVAIFSSDGSGLVRWGVSEVYSCRFLTDVQLAGVIVAIFFE